MAGILSNRAAPCNWFLLVANKEVTGILCEILSLGPAKGLIAQTDGRAKILVTVREQFPKLNFKPGHDVRPFHQ